MKFLKLAIIAAFVCTLFSFITKIPPSPNNAIVEDVCCFVYSSGGPLSKCGYNLNFPIEVYVKNSRSTQMTFIMKDSTNTAKISQVIRLNPQWDSKGLINISSLKKNTKYKMLAIFNYGVSGTFTTPEVEVTIK